MTKKKQKKDRKNELRKLKIENRRLRKELALLRFRAGRDALPAVDTPAVLLHRAARTEKDLLRGSYFRALVRSLRQSTLYELFLRLLTYFRRLRLVSVVASFISYAIALIGTGALLLVYLTAAGIFLFALLLFSAVIFFLTVWERRYWNRFFSSFLKGKRVFVFFPTRGQNLSASPMARTVHDLADDRTVVFLVSPFFFNDRRGMRPYFSVRRDADGIFSVRPQYYYYFQKRLLPSLRERITLIF